MKARSDPFKSGDRSQFISDIEGTLWQIVVGDNLLTYFTCAFPVEEMSLACAPAALGLKRLLGLMV